SKCMVDATRTLAHAALRRVYDTVIAGGGAGAEGLSERLQLYGYDFGQIAMHSKFMCTELALLFGSSNFDFYSGKWDQEYIVRLTHRGIMTNVLDYVTEMLLPRCQPIRSSACHD